MKKVYVIDNEVGHKTPWVMERMPYPEVGEKYRPVLKDGKPVLNVPECEKIKRSCVAVAAKDLPLMWMADPILPVEETGDGVLLRIVDVQLPGGKAEF